MPSQSPLKDIIHFYFLYESLCFFFVITKKQRNYIFGETVTGWKRSMSPCQYSIISSPSYLAVVTMWPCILNWKKKYNSKSLGVRTKGSHVEPAPSFLAHRHLASHPWKWAGTSKRYLLGDGIHNVPLSIKGQLQPIRSPVGETYRQWNHLVNQNFTEARITFSIMNIFQCCSLLPFQLRNTLQFWHNS